MSGRANIEVPLSAPDKAIVEGVRRQAASNWKEGKEYEAERRKQLLLSGSLAEAAKVREEWRHVSWYVTFGDEDRCSVGNGHRLSRYRENGWTPSAKGAVQRLGYHILADDPDCLNVLIRWDTPTPP